MIKYQNSMGLEESHTIHVGEEFKLLKDLKI